MPEDLVSGKSSLLLFKGTNSIPEDSAFMIYHLRKVPPLSTITLGIKFSHMHFRVHICSASIMHTLVLMIVPFQFCSLFLFFINFYFAYLTTWFWVTCLWVHQFFLLLKYYTETLNWIFHLYYCILEFQNLFACLFIVPISLILFFSGTVFLIFWLLSVYSSISLSFSNNHYFKFFVRQITDLHFGAGLVTRNLFLQ